MNIKKIFSFGILLLIIFLSSASFSLAALPPTIVPAESGSPTTPTTVNEIFSSFALGNQAGFFPVLIWAGLVTFTVGVIKFLGAGDNEEKKSQGKNVMIFGIVVLFVMVSMWGFVRLLTQSFFGKNPETPSYLPPLL